MRFVGVLIALAFSWSVKADLQVFPTRIVLDETKRTGQVSVRHRGPEETTYRISTVYYKMKADGSMEQVEQPKSPKDSAAGFFKFSPRQVNLKPNIEQVVRMQLRLPPTAEDGEYRAHLHFESVDKPVTETKEDSQANGPVMQLKAKMAVAIPIILRKGKPQVTGKLSDLKIVKAPDGKSYYQVKLKKDGRANIYGDFVAILKTKSGEKEVGRANGVSSYIDERVVSYPVQLSSKDKGVLRLELRKNGSEGDDLIDFKEITL